MKHLALAAVVLSCAGLSVPLRAQAPGASPSDFLTSNPQVRFNAGQSVVPYYEGWIKNTDGSFDLVFGYFNRNWQQELVIPAGPGNKVEPGAPDQGQPTYFLPRRNRWIFRLRVPANFGSKEITWTLTANGRTERVVGSLLASEEINERVVATNGNFDPGENDANVPPAIAIQDAASAVAGSPLRLSASVTDDGLPKPRTPSAPKPTATAGPQSQFGAQVTNSGTARPRGLTLRWLQYGGPAKAVFESGASGSVTPGQANAASVRFTAPGVYRLIALANDGAMSRRRDVTVTVTAP